MGLFCMSKEESFLADREFLEMLKLMEEDEDYDLWHTETEKDRAIGIFITIFFIVLNITLIIFPLFI